MLFDNCIQRHAVTFLFKTLRAGIQEYVVIKYHVCKIRIDPNVFLALRNCPLIFVPKEQLKSLISSSLSLLVCEIK